ncbi:MAG: protein-disulfide reductase DsbD family protein [Gemmatimonadetes bacterium]|nr:protein-disulfide reductase DsbD family protein [Gemmatimonadota bacterium]
MKSTQHAMKSLRATLLTLAILIAFVAGTWSVHGQAVRTDYMETELVVETTSIKPGQPFWAGLRMKMDEHWHTYWRNPADSGLPTKIHWTLPDGFQAGEINWPYPQKIELDILASYGYEGETLLLVEITPPADLEPGGTVDVGAFASWLVCADICLPGESGYQVTLPVSTDAPQADERWTDLFARARENLPVAVPGWHVDAAISDSTVALHATPPEWFSGNLTSAEFYPYNADLIDYISLQKLEMTETGYLLTMRRSGFYTDRPQQIAGVLVSPDGWRGPGSERALAVSAVYADVLPAAVAAIGPPGSPGSSGSGDGSAISGLAATAVSGDLVSGLWQALLFALVGGMILNLMPCVLPVLSIKVLGFIHQAGDDPAKARRHGLVFTAGVLVSFLALAAVLIALRAGGEQLGWGFQLQSPAFIVVLSVIIFMFGLSLFGVFEIGTSLVGLGGRMDSGSGLGGSFLSGVLATVVATPCTAPFMGVALGYALTQSAVQSLAIFGFLGLGMALPYLTLSSVPALLRYVPKPGAWMESFKQFMGFLMMATVVWLLWVLNLQTDPNLVALVMVLLVLVALGSWILGRWGGIASGSRSRLAARAAAAVIIVASMTAVLSQVPAPANAERTAAAPANSAGLEWEPFSRQLVRELRASGKSVFVDFTAAWCLSCQVNKRVALSDSRVVEQFETLGVVTVQADWTSRDPEITQALAEFGRNSVPLYVLYTGSPDSEPEILPELLTPGLVLDALKKVESGRAASR